MEKSSDKMVLRILTIVPIILAVFLGFQIYYAIKDAREAIRQDETYIQEIPEPLPYNPSDYPIGKD